MWAGNAGKGLAAPGPAGASSHVSCEGKLHACGGSRGRRGMETLQLVSCALPIKGACVARFMQYGD